MLLNDVNEDVAAEYIKRQQKALKPVMNIATSIKWELNKVIEVLESQKTLFKKFLDETTNTTNPPCQKKLKRYSFEEQLRLDKAVSKYISSIATGIRDEMRGEIIGIITKFEGMMMSTAFIMFVILLVIAGLIALFSIGLIVAYHVGLCGTSCFRTTTQNNRKVVRRTVVSHRGGVLLLVFCYIISNFLWISCLCCVFLFLLTSLPLIGCRAVKDMTILDLTLDSSAYLPYHEIKSQLNFTDVVANFTKQISKLSPEKFVGYDTVDTGGLAGVLDSVNITPAFQVMKGFLIDLNRRNFSEMHSKMKNYTKVSKAAPLLDAAQKTYDSLVSHLSTALSNSEVFQSTLKIVPSCLY
ncbi:uncharacterized protein CEXT_269091 [Caerostris extrusa]|uniref:Uncharacterized protein n=1 Tax=Caerostris extrusa TaxID=172846 RepID=A0AAV4R5U1_CAEEX|nr:uncharacterized protein CEXT_269091 [Caerostris extrusa]